MSLIGGFGRERDQEAETELLRRFLGRDPEVWQTVAKWARDAVSFKYPSISEPDRADLVPQALVELFHYVSQNGFELTKGLQPLVRKIVLARCEDVVRRRKPSAEIGEWLEDPKPDPLEDLISGQVSDRVLRALRDLTRECLELMILRYYEGKKLVDIAEESGEPPGTVRTRHARCLKQTRQLWLRSGGGRSRD